MQRIAHLLITSVEELCDNRRDKRTDIMVIISTALLTRTHGTVTSRAKCVCSHKITFDNLPKNLTFLGVYLVDFLGFYRDFAAVRLAFTALTHNA
jgi:hypothetical protein